MDFKMQIDDEADEYLPGIEKNDCVVQVGDAEIVVHMGNDLEAHIPLDAVAGAEAIDDPRPAVYLPLGISAAVEQLGRDTLVAIGSYANLVRLDLNRQVEVHSTAAGLVQAVQPEGPMAALHPRHLILSLADRDGFTRAVGERAAASAASPAEPAEPVQDDWGKQGVRSPEG